MYCAVCIIYLIFLFSFTSLLPTATLLCWMGVNGILTEYYKYEEGLWEHEEELARFFFNNLLPGSHRQWLNIPENFLFVDPIYR